MDNVWRTADDGLSLQRTSPAINAGTNTVELTTDITDSTRISAPDIGAYERLNNNANLSNLTTNRGTISPTFAPDSLTYAITVPDTALNIMVTPTADDSSSVVEVKINSGTFSTVASGSASSTLALNVGSNTIIVKVTAPNGYYN